MVSERAFAVEDLSCAPLFVVVAEDEQTTAKIYEECKQRAIPVNAVDMPAYCDLIFPSLFTTENLCIGISSGGKSPTATLHFKDEIKNLVPSGIDQIIDWMVDARERLKTILPKEHLSVALRELFGVSVKNNRPPTADEFAKTIERLKC